LGSHSELFKERENNRERARAKIKVMVKRILNKYSYPPDLPDDAVKTVLAQAELLCADWVVAG
jgi:type I restriction enzyme R subunit